MALINARADYALRALLHLALQPAGAFSQSRDIAECQQIPEAYLNQLLVALRRAGLVRSQRGAAGGYALQKSPSGLSVLEVLRALQCVDAAPEEPSGDAAGARWAVAMLRSRMQQVVEVELAAITLAELLASMDRASEAQSVMIGL